MPVLKDWCSDMRREANHTPEAAKQYRIDSETCAVPLPGTNYCHGEKGVGCRRHVSKVCTSGVTCRMVSCHAATVRAATRALRS